MREAAESLGLRLSKEVGRREEEEEPTPTTPARGGGAVGSKGDAKSSVTANGRVIKREGRFERRTFERMFKLRG